jgi:hypothetical protein
MYIIFNGPPRSGKDEACRFLVSNYSFKHLQFKDELFKETADHFGVSLEWFMQGYNSVHEGVILKEIPRKELNGLSKRKALIYVSEEIIKPKFGKNYFGVKTAEKIDQVSSYCFSDGGFIEEVSSLINIIGQENICIVQLVRDGCNFSSDSRNYMYGILQEEFGHKSNFIENNQKDNYIPIRMYRLYNNTSVSDFHQSIRKILGKEANVYKKGSYISRKSV